MNDKQRLLIQYICNGDIKRAQQQARIILNESTVAKDEAFKKNMLHKLDVRPNLTELPHNLQGLLIAEDASNFPESRFVLRAEEAKTVDLVLHTIKASNRLSELGISYLPALMIYGESGSGKTMLARYIAHIAKIPFIYVRFSGLVSSYLGSTQANIAKVFDYVRSAPCVLCFDEVDAVGMARGQKNDVGEMNRIVIALMQEMDRLPNNVIMIGTTNRYDRLDPALVRRFPIKFESLPMSREDINILAEKFFRDVGIATEGWLDEWCGANFGDKEPASAVAEKCIRLVIDKIVKDECNNPL